MTEPSKKKPEATESCAKSEENEQISKDLKESNEIEEIIEELEKVPKKRKEEIIQSLIKVERNSYSGPIPPPALLKGYEDILPGSADRILKMAEKQSDHRREIEKIAVESGARDSRLGIICGTIVCITVCITGIVLSLLTESAALGAFLSLSSLASLVGVFIYGTRSNSNERAKKSKTETKEKQTDSK